MGETLAQVQFRDNRLIRRAGRPVVAEPLVLDNAFLADAGNPALLSGHRAFATVALVAPGATDAAAIQRDLLAEPGVTAAASEFDGKTVLRLLAVNGWPLRRVIARVLARLTGRPLPRVWQI